MPDKDTQKTEEQQNKSPERSDIDANKDKAAFSYVWAMSIVMFFLGRDSAYVRYHASQGMLLFCLSILGFMINPYSPAANRSLQFAIFILACWGFYNGFTGKKRELPIVGALSHGHINFDWSIKHLKEDFRLATKMAKDVLDDKGRDERLKKKLDARQKEAIRRAYYEGLQGGSLDDFSEVEEHVEREAEENPELKKQIAREEIRRRRLDSKLGHDRYIRYANNISIDRRSEDRLNDLTDEKFIDEDGNIKSKEVPWKQK